jgi:hypothetical protein
MERPQTLANTWLFLQILGFVFALDSLAQYFSDRHYQDIYRKFLLYYFYIARGLDHDPARPEPPESWEEWYNS